MRIKVSDFVADFLVNSGIRTVFTVVGGGAMHLNDSFGHHSQLKCIYNHHEQASSIAAEAYFRVNREMACCCVTSGPGAINALNGVVGAYQDSIPMMVFSGQTKTSLMARNSGLDIRTLGNQEYDIVPTLMNATKYAVTVMKPIDIKKELEKALYIATNGRPGPCWIELPIDIQGAYVDSDELEGFMPETPDDRSFDFSLLLSKLSNAKRPVIYAGNGVRIAGAVEELREVARKYEIPVVTCWDSIDVIETNNKEYVGRAGIMGDRAGNFAIQNSDLVLAIGNRLSVYQVGYNISTWAREAYVIDVDIDPVEFEKPTIRVDLPICCDAKVFLKKLLNKDISFSVELDGWNQRCSMWKKKYPVMQEKYFTQTEKVNVYALIDYFSKILPEDSITVVANGSASVVGSAVYDIKGNQRFIMNCALSSMGYDLPAAVGASVAAGREVYCIAGDGSIMMNLQELQTIVTNRLPVKILLINNQGYHQIRLTQTNIFNKNFVGIGPESEDLSFPSFEKISNAFGIPYNSCGSNSELSSAIEWLLNNDSFAMLEVFCDTEQTFLPKSATKRLEDGSLYSPPLEDLMPFLDRKELEENMLISMVEE